MSRAREYSGASWAIEDTTTALHDRPRYRYRETGISPYHSPIVEWINDCQQGLFGGQFTGVPYAYGARFTPELLHAWLSSYGPEAIGLSQSVWSWRFAHREDPDYEIDWIANGPGWGFACCSDCSGMAGYATMWESWNSLGTAGMLQNAQSGESTSHYIELCDWHTGECTGDYSRYEVARKGDLLVKDDGLGHVMVVSSVNPVSIDVVECTGDSQFERCVERSIGHDYVELLGAGYHAVAVRGIQDLPATRFLGVGATRSSVVWRTLFLKDTWAFAIRWSPDGRGDWVRLGNYIFPRTATYDGLMEFRWEGPIRDGFVQVVEIERKTQRLTASRTVRVAD